MRQQLSDPYAWTDSATPRQQKTTTRSKPMKSGKVKWFNDVKGYGFVTSDEGRDHFVHKKDLNGVQIREGDDVAFDLEPVPGKGDKAVNVELR
jgi:cold shock protein